MKGTDIYQTLEDRQNYGYIESNGPFFCSVRDEKGNLKRGIHVPWLGEGYYFWDTRIEDAHWWGRNVYPRKGYVVCHTTYDQHSPLLYDLVGDIGRFEEFVKSANWIKKSHKLNRITFPVVLAYLRKDPSFVFKAVRAWPFTKVVDTGIVFPHGENEKDNIATLGKLGKIQICFFDRTLLTDLFHIVCKNTFDGNQTI